MEFSNEHGTLKVSEEVMATVIRDAVLACEGVAAMAHGGRWPDVWGRDDPDAGVGFQRGESGQLGIDVYVVVAYGSRLAALGRSVAQRVSAAFERAFGAVPERVVIHIEGVRG